MATSSSALDASGEVVLAVEEGAITSQHVADELGDVIAGLRPGREDDRQITLYNSVGVAIQDVSVGCLVVAKAQRQGLGLRLTSAPSVMSG